jgi:hypothetical protein
VDGAGGRLDPLPLVAKGLSRPRGEEGPLGVQVTSAAGLNEDTPTAQLKDSDSGSAGL